MRRPGAGAVAAPSYAYSQKKGADIVRLCVYRAGALPGRGFLGGSGCRRAWCGNDCRVFVFEVHGLVRCDSQASECLKKFKQRAVVTPLLCQLSNLTGQCRYNERVGTLTVVSESKAVSENAFEHVLRCARVCYSNPRMCSPINFVSLGRACVLQCLVLRA